MYICTRMYMHIFFCLENTHIYMQTRFRTHSAQHVQSDVMKTIQCARPPHNINNFVATGQL